MSERKRYRLLTGKHGRWEPGPGAKGEDKTYRAGDEILLTEDEAAGASLAGRVELLDAPGPKATAAPPAEDPAPKPARGKKVTKKKARKA